jgi:surface antigen
MGIATQSSVGGATPGMTVTPNVMLIFWRDPAAGDPRVAADIKPGDAEAAQQAYAVAYLYNQPGKFDWSNPETRHSGWIEVDAAYYDPGGSKCRHMKHAYAINGMMVGKNFTTCANAKGSWTTVTGSGRAFTEPLNS